MKSQKYPKIIVDDNENEIWKAFAILQEQLRTEVLQNNDDIKPFTLKYRPNNPNMFPNVREERY